MSLQSARRNFDQKNYGLAKTELQKYLQDQNQDPEAYFLMGMILQKLDEEQLSQNYFAICLQLDPFHSNCLMQLAQVFVQHQKCEDAIELLDKFKKRGTTWRCEFLLGRAYQAMSQYQKSAKHYRSCLTLRPGFTRCQKNLFKVEKKIMKFQQSKQFTVEKLQKKVSDLQTQKEKLLQKRKKQISTKKQQTDGHVSYCVVCCVQKTSFANNSCGHQSVCQFCVTLLKNKCPICQKFGQYIRIYKA